MAGAERIQDWLERSNFDELSEPVIGDPYGLYPEPQQEPDVINEEELDLVFSADANDSDRYSEDEVHQRPVKKVSWLEDGKPVGSIEDDCYSPQPFMYNGRILLVAIPGFLLTLSVGGDLLLTVITIGGIITYLLHSAEEDRKSVVSYMICFACCQMTILYSVFPLLWLSLYNFVLLSSLNMFCVLTGGWGIIQFEKFRTDEKDMTKLIEAMLFTLYPAVNLVLIAWFVGSAISPLLAPYTLLVLGFIVFQFFLTPKVSSFCRPDEKGNYKHYVIEPEMTGAVAVINCLVTPMLFTVMCLLRYRWTSLGFEHLIECLFLFFTSMFLSSLLNLRPFFNLTEIPFKNVLMVRWVSGIGALLLVSFVLQSYGFQLFLLPWLPIGIIIHAAYGFMISQKNTKAHGMVAACGLGMLYAFMFYKLPWTLEYFVSTALQVNTVQFLLAINAALCIICAYVSVYWSAEILGFVLLVQSMGYVLCESALLTSLHHIPLVLLSTGLAVYLFLNLYYVSKIPKQHSWISTSLHVTKLLVTLNTYIEPGSKSNWDYMNYLVTFFLCLVLTYIVFFETASEITSDKFATYAAAVLFTSVLGGYKCLGDIYILIMGSHPSAMDYVGLTLLAVGLSALKLSISHQCHLKWSKHISVVILVFAFTVMHLQPDLSFEGVDQARWLFIFSLVSAFIVIPLSIFMKSRVQLVFFANCIGVPLGAALGLTLYADLVPGSTVVLYAFVFGQLAALCLVSWKGKGSGLSSSLNKLILLVALACGILILDDLVAPIDDVTFLPGFLSALISALITSLILKLSPLKEKMENADLTVSGDIKISHLAVIGNASTVLAFILTLYTCPTEYWEMWYVGASVILLLLQRDSLLLEKLSQANYYTPMIVVTTIVLNVSTFQGSSYFNYTNTIHLLTGLVEILLLFVTLPNYVVFVSKVWFQRTILSEKFVVFLTPLYVFLFIFGTTNVAWITATFGLGVGIWMIKYSISFEVDERK